MERRARDRDACILRARDSAACGLASNASSNNRVAAGLQREHHPHDAADMREREHERRPVAVADIEALCGRAGHDGVGGIGVLRALGSLVVPDVYNNQRTGNSPAVDGCGGGRQRPRIAVGERAAIDGEHLEAVVGRRDRVGHRRVVDTRARHRARSTAWRRSVFVQKPTSRSR